MKKAELLIHRRSSAFITLFVYLYNMMLVVSYISSSYNRVRIVRRGWENKKNSPSFLRKLDKTKRPFLHIIKFVR